MTARQAPAPSSTRQRWIVVADSPFLPAHGGGELEHLGFLQAAVRRDLVAALVVPTDADPEQYGRQDDLRAIAELVAPAPVLFAPRRRGLVSAATPWRPYVVGSRPPYKGMVADLRAMAPDATGVVVFAYKSQRLGRVVANGLGLPAIVRMHNLEGRYHRALARSEGGLKGMAMRLEAARVEADERILERARWHRGIADISQADARSRTARSRVPARHVSSFSFGALKLEAATARLPAPQPTVVFVGALDVATNHDAIAWFAARVWPAVLAAVPDARWQVVGRQPPSWLKQDILRTPGAELHADVRRPQDYLERAWVAVNPAVSGSGVNIKLVEYLATGVPVVSTTLGASGIGLDPGVHIEMADDPAGFARCVVHSLVDRDHAERLGRSGRAYAETVLEVDRSLDALVELISSGTRGRSS